MVDHCFSGSCSCHLVVGKTIWIALPWVLSVNLHCFISSSLDSQWIYSTMSPLLRMKKKKTETVHLLSSRGPNLNFRVRPTEVYRLLALNMQKLSPLKLYMLLALKSI